MNSKIKGIQILLSTILLVGVFALGLYLGYSKKPYIERVQSVSAKEQPEGFSADFSEFWRVWNTIDEKYPGAEEVSAQDRVYGAIKGLVDSLGDDYSVFFTPEEAEDFEATISGSFEGVGMEVGLRDRILTVIAPLKNTPADRAGIKAGDLILKIGDTVTSGMSVDKAVQLIRGPRGTEITLTILGEADDQPKEVTIVRDRIVIPTLDTEVKGDVFIIKLYNFGPSSARLMSDALTSFRQTGLSKLIIDLRNNPGGYLDAAVDIAGFFLPEGEAVVIEDFGKDTSPKTYRSKGYGLVNNKKIAVLVDGGSASASEILAGALREHEIATLIGTQTYGKGSVQQVIDISEGTILKITVAKWLTPKGISISKEGLKPDIEIMPDPETEDDEIMDTALEFLK